MEAVLVRPLVTEKCNKLQESLNQYSFEVIKSATKPQIKEAIEKMYPEVNVVRVNTLIVASKPKGRFTRGGYIDGRSKQWKKAIITLQKGQEIDLFEEV
jgi:large subunit ribosomal protein L23